MSGYLGKPFSAQELWRCLMDHLTPVSLAAVDQDGQAAEYEELQRLLRLNFVQSNQSTFAELQKALRKGNIKLAHRLAHTLKGNAGQIGEKKLQEAAAAAEGLLLGGENRLTQEQSDILEVELKSVLDKLAPMLAEANEPKAAEDLDDEKRRRLFERLETMLVNSNPECMDLIGDLRAVPGTEELVRQMEDFDFERAVGAFLRLKETMRIS
jgi:HPt (histidine-containing phosphotransfer) domain-containing protein